MSGNHVSHLYRDVEPGASVGRSPGAQAAHNLHYLAHLHVPQLVAVGSQMKSVEREKETGLSSRHIVCGGRGKTEGKVLRYMDILVSWTVLLDILFASHE